MGYRAASAPPPPGSSPDLPPGFASAEQKAAAKRRARRKSRVGAVVVGLIILAALGVTVLMVVMSDRQQTVADLDVGACFAGDPSDLDIVECDQPHDGELVARLEATDPDGDFPEDELGDPTSLRCEAELNEYFGADRDVVLASGLDLRVFAPSEADWEDGKRQVECVVVQQDGGRFTGSVKDRGAEVEDSLQDG